MSVDRETASPDVKMAAFGRFAFKSRNSSFHNITGNATVLSEKQMVNSSGSVQGHRQDSVRSSSLKDKPVRREKRNINASIFDESDDETDTAVDQMLPHKHKLPDLPKTIVSCECLCEQSASSKLL